MYYYVFEQPSSNNERKLHDKVRQYLEDFNVLGEITVASPARSAEELTDMGMRKGTSTIIAVGSDAHINRVVSMIKTLERGLRRNIVFGVIPLDQESSLKERLRLSSIQDACSALRFRRYATVDMGYIEGIRYFLTSAELHSASPIEIKLKADRWEANHKVTDLIIFSDLTFSFYNTLESKKGVRKFVSWLIGSNAESSEVSIFRARTLQVTSNITLPIYIEGEMVAKTPVVVYKMPRALKIIIKRDKFIEVIKNNEEKL